MTVWCVAVCCCSVFLQCIVAEFCRVLQCVAVCCSMLQSLGNNPYRQSVCVCLSLSFFLSLTFSFSLSPSPSPSTLSSFASPFLVLSRSSRRTQIHTQACVTGDTGRFFFFDFSKSLKVQLLRNYDVKQPQS